MRTTQNNSRGDAHAAPVPAGSRWCRWACNPARSPFPAPARSRGAPPMAPGVQAAASHAPPRCGSEAPSRALAHSHAMHAHRPPACPKAPRIEHPDRGWGCLSKCRRRGKLQHSLIEIVKVQDIHPACRNLYLLQKTVAWVDYFKYILFCISQFRYCVDGEIAR